MTLEIDLSGKGVLVTGGTRGIGRSIARRFAEAGANVAVVARSDPGDLPGDWVLRTVDVRDPDAVTDAIDQCAAALGRLDVLVNNAGGAPPADTATVSPRYSERVVALNLLAPIWCSQAARPHLLAEHVQDDGGGNIVNICSVAAIRPAPTVAAYGAAKAGLLSYTTTIGQEWAPAIRTNAVTVGLVYTDDAGGHYGDDDTARRIADTIPMGRFATTDDVADACVYLASPLAAYVTGANLAVHGGGDRPPFLDAATR
ncbi:MAG: SDR family oxidoreductase [Ilumatobacteraceae bacterium]